MKKLAIAMVLTAAACGGSDDTSEPTDAPAATDAPPETDAPLEADAPPETEAPARDRRGRPG